MQIDTILQETLKNKPKASLPQIKTALQEVKNLNFSTPTNSNKELIASYDIPVNATQQLHVTLSVAGENSNQQERCRIITWNVISTTDWKSETHLPVIGSEYKGEKCK